MTSETFLVRRHPLTLRHPLSHLFLSFSERVLHLVAFSWLQKNVPAFRRFSSRMQKVMILLGALVFLGFFLLAGMRVMLVLGDIGGVFGETVRG